MFLRLLLLSLLCGGCVHTSEVRAEEKRLEELRARLDHLKQDIKDLPPLMAEVRQLEDENSTLLRQLRKRRK